VMESNLLQHFFDWSVCTKPGEWEAPLF
jgi:hypothetical protein